MGLELVDVADHAVLEPVGLAAAVHHVQEEPLPLPEGHVAPLADLHAPHGARVHAVERVVHEGLDRVEHGGHEVRVLVRFRFAGQVDERHAAVVRQVHALDHAARGQDGHIRARGAWSRGT